MRRTACSCCEMKSTLMRNNWYQRRMRLGVLLMTGLVFQYSLFSPSRSNFSLFFFPWRGRERCGECVVRWRIISCAKIHQTGLVIISTGAREQKVFTPYFYFFCFLSSLFFPLPNIKTLFLMSQRTKGQPPPNTIRAFFLFLSFSFFLFLFISFSFFFFLFLSFSFSHSPPLPQIPLIRCPREWRGWQHQWWGRERRTNPHRTKHTWFGRRRFLFHSFLDLSE
jgi:hypothetical protein